MDWSLCTPTVALVLLIILAAEASNGFSDAPTGTSAAVASGALTSRAALWITAVGNFIGLIAALYFGAKVARTIGTGIVQPDVITIASIGVGMATTIVWAVFATWLGLPVSKTHSILAALAGIGYAQGGFEALLPSSGLWADSGWVAAGKGVVMALLLGSALAFVLARTVKTSGLADAISDGWWRTFQVGTVCAVATGHGFNDGLKYVGVFTLVLYKAGIIKEFEVFPVVIVVCAVVMGAGTLLGGWRIHRRLDGMVNDEDQASEAKEKGYRPYMGVCSELTAGCLIWQSGFLGIPMSTNHGVVSAMAGAKSSDGKLHRKSVWRIWQGWIATYAVCFFLAQLLTDWLL